MAFNFFIGAVGESIVLIGTFEIICRIIEWRRGKR
jgi:hypothetical protein